ncbi:hypothetical protein ACGFIE_07645 [Micromonospora sp. NPDC049275]|uniref:hypothetical protein n=1 Tax=Micromonospora sp. NPDC049275 TaxID=3364268 RepID=UPI0037117A3A
METDGIHGRKGGAVLPTTSRFKPIARVVTALTLLVALVTAVPAPASAAPWDKDACAGQQRAVEQVLAQIKVHNAKPHLFTLPRQAAAYNAYNAEAAALDAARTQAAAALTACASAIAAMADQRPGSPTFTPPTARELSDLTEALKKIPPNFPPRTTPVGGGNTWTVPMTSPERPLFDVLRNYSPGDPRNWRAFTLQGQRMPTIGAADPSAPGRVVGVWPKSGAPGVSPDHIVPLARMIYMPNFMKLTPQNMFRVANAPVNFQWMSRWANTSKGSRSVGALTKFDPAWQAAQVRREARAYRQLQDIINKLVKSQG